MSHSWNFHGCLEDSVVVLGHWLCQGWPEESEKLVARVGGYIGLGR
jgi:hypothetical protein